MKKIIKNLEEYIGGALFSIMFIILVMQIFSRQILNAPLIWSEELARLIFVYVAMIGVVLGIKHSQHVGITILSDKFPPLLEKIMNIIKDIGVFIIIIILFKVGMSITIRKSSLDLVSLGISSGYLYAALPIGSVFMMGRFLERVYLDRKIINSHKVKVN